MRIMLRSSNIFSRVWHTPHVVTCDGPSWLPHGTQTIDMFESALSDASTGEAVRLSSLEVLGRTTSLVKSVADQTDAEPYMADRMPADTT